MAYEAELSFAADLARAMGDNMRQSLRVGHDFTEKEDGSPLTEVDIANNRLAIEAISGRFPSDGVLGEEESSSPNAPRRWHVDPVDGTSPFRRGIPVSVVLLSLEEDGEPKVGVIYNPYVDQLFCAAKGLGAFVNGERYHVSDAPTLQEAAIGTTGPDPSNLFNLRAVRDDLAAARAKLYTLGSTGYELAMVGAGQYDGQIFGGDTRHDIAAGDLFITQAGGRVTDILGNKLDYSKPLNGSVASNGLIHDALLEITTRRAQM